MKNPSIKSVKVNCGTETLFGCNLVQYQERQSYDYVLALVMMQVLLDTMQHKHDARRESYHMTITLTAFVLMSRRKPERQMIADDDLLILPFTDPNVNGSFPFPQLFI